LSVESGRHPSDAAGDGGSRRSLPERLAPLVPGLLLIFVALNQLHLARTQDLDPWKGGGFGMFATSQTRHTHVFAIESGGEREVDLPRSLDDLEDRLRVLPTEGRLDEFGRELAETLSATYPDLQAVRVELWTTSYDVEDLTPATVRIRDVEIAAPGRGTR